VAADIGRSSRNTEECDMVTYVGLMSFTEKGIQSVKETTKRAAAAKELAKKAGVNMKEILWTMGEYDLVCVLEAEDEQALAAFSLGVAMQGNVRARSLRAWRSFPSRKQGRSGRWDPRRSGYEVDEPYPRHWLRS
jgi:uncharacterized protein with GYD domain